MTRNGFNTIDHDAMRVWNEVAEIDSSDRNVKKFVFTSADAVAESVLYKYPTYNERTVICCSTQSGCPVGCRFCGAGDNFVRNLTTSEIVAQPVHLIESQDIVAADVERMQIMFMSMGEPLLNLKALIPGLYTLHDLFPKAALLISTSAPRIGAGYTDLAEVSQAIKTIGLQFSVHESTDEARNLLVPFKAKLSLMEMAMEGQYWAAATGRRPFLNYCVHEGNNTWGDVERLMKHFDPRTWEATISVICERDESIAAANDRQRQLAGDFMNKMVGIGYSTRMFDPAGQDDIGGGCGQLWYVQDWMANHPDLARPSIGAGKPVVHTPAAL